MRGPILPKPYGSAHGDANGSAHNRPNGNAFHKPIGSTHDRPNGADGCAYVTDRPPLSHWKGSEL